MLSNISVTAVFFKWQILFLLNSNQLNVVSAPCWTSSRPRSTMWCRRPSWSLRTSSENIPTSRFCVNIRGHSVISIISRYVSVKVVRYNSVTILKESNIILIQLQWNPSRFISATGLSVFFFYSKLNKNRKEAQIQHFPSFCLTVFSSFLPSFLRSFYTFALFFKMSQILCKNISLGFNAKRQVWNHSENPSSNCCICSQNSASCLDCAGERSGIMCWIVTLAVISTE